MLGSSFARLASSFVRTLVAGALIAVCAADAPAEELRSAKTLPESRQLLLSDTTARAFDHVRAARRQIAAKQGFEARKELAQATTLLAQARSASPGTQVREEISRLWIRLQDPTLQVNAAEFETLFAFIDGADDAVAYSATRRYVERARYFRKDGDSASRELVAAAARIPHGVLDGPLADAYARVHIATIELYGGALDAADDALARAERSTLAAVRIAGGAHDAALADVAAPAEPGDDDRAGGFPPEPATAESEPALTESEIPAPAEFREPRDDRPAESEAAPAPGA
jgi:hypothetical protein